ncbi:response regulator transcription factor [Streptomyces sp. TLI_105]|uniref:response regulator transcription factor n=1 Tax=Streptomyces sp. TLI_105 TaxID=1881019 RepID=UPI000894E40C|nr:helix-turn-helix transcriptional regulator [Streptomyces sp. TLI_105]SEC96288.1 regulatory protein, luxR family [Streptomyces sp. TLI_105]
MTRAGIFVENQLALLGIRYLLDAEADIQVAFATSTPFAVTPGSVDCLVVDRGLLGELPPAVPAARTVLLTEGPEKGRETGPEIGSETGRETGPEIGPETGLETGPETGSGTGRGAGSERAGATLPFDDAPLMLVDAIRRVAAPGPAPARQGVATLSPREREVLGHLVEGCTHDQAARRIGISQHTVDTYVKRIRSKLGAHNKAQLVRAALTTPRAPAAHPEPRQRQQVET